MRVHLFILFCEPIVRWLDMKPLPRKTYNKQLFFNDISPIYILTYQYKRFTKFNMENNQNPRQKQNKISRIIL